MWGMAGARTAEGIPGGVSLADNRPTLSPDSRHAYFLCLVRSRRT